MKNLDELKKLRDEVKQRLEMRSGEHSARVIICMGTCGIAAGARDTMNAFLDLVSESGRTDIMVTASGCAGFCEREPMVRVAVGEEPEVVYGKVDPEGAGIIFESHLLNNQVVEKYLFSRES